MTATRYKPTEAQQVTDQYKGKTRVIFHHAATDIYEQATWITKGELAKHFHYSRVIGAINGIPVVEV